MLQDRNKKFSNEDVRKIVFACFKYILVNILTCGAIVAFLFLISLMMGFETEDGVRFFNSHILHTIMMPLIIWYFGFLAFNDGYRHSVSDKYDKRKILIPAIAVFAVQIAIVLLSVNEAANHVEDGFFTAAATFLMCPYRILFDNFAEYMPVLMILPTPIASVAMYVGYDMARHKEIDDHLIKDDAKNFRDMLENEQYNKKEQNGDKTEWH